MNTAMLEASPPLLTPELLPPPARASSLRRFARRVRRALASASEWVFGGVALVIGLAVLSSIPVLQLLSFGYLLEASGRVARSGRLRDAFIGVRRAARLGSMAIGCGLIVLPLQLVSSLATSAQIIDPDGPIARRWRIGLAVWTIATVVFLVAACARGGRLRHFAWPFGNPLRRPRLRGFHPGQLYVETRDAVYDFLQGLRLPYYFRLGFLGFVGTAAWLVVPVTLIAAGRRFVVLGIIGGLMLGVVSLALPFLQVRFAREGRFRALFEYRGIRARFQRAPWAFAAALLVTLSLAVPLYLLKIEMIPRETAWLPALVFVLFIFPARALTGWAYARADRRETPRHWTFRWSTRLALVPVAAAYVGIVFLSQYTAWYGIWSLYEQHAFLLPVPFLNM